MVHVEDMSVESLEKHLARKKREQEESNKAKGQIYHLSGIGWCKESNGRKQKDEEDLFENKDIRVTKSPRGVTSIYFKRSIEGLGIE